MAKDKVEGSGVSKESVDFLEQAKKGKPRKFAMICKGTNVVSLVVFKKGSYEKRKKEAKESGKGQFYFGVINGQGMDMQFTMARADGFESDPVKPTVLKAFLDESADFKCKPSFVFVDQLEAVLDEDDPLVQRFLQLKPTAQQLAASNANLAPQITQLLTDIISKLEEDDSSKAAGPIEQLAGMLNGNPASPNQSAPATPSENVPPPPPPPPPPTQTPDEVLKAKLGEALKKLKPLLEQALLAQPARKAELLNALKVARDSLEQNQLTQAQGQIVELSKTLKGIIAESPAPSSNNGDTSSDAATAFAARQQTVSTRVAAAVQVAPDKAEALQKVLAFAAQQASKGDYTAANTALDKLEQALNGIDLAQASTANTPTADAQFDQDTEFARMFSSIEPRYLNVLRQGHEDAGKLRAVMDFANGKAEQGDLKAALAALAKLESMIDEMETQILNETVDSLVREEDSTRGVVAQRKALLVWDSLRKAAFDQVETLQVAVAAEYPNANIARLDTVFEEIDNSLHDALVDYINAEDDVDRAHYHQTVVQVVERMRATIDSSIVINGIDRNPFVKTKLKSDLHEALSSVVSLLEVKQS